MKPYNVDSETEAEALIDESKTDRSFKLTGYKSKEYSKQKGEIVDFLFNSRTNKNIRGIRVVGIYSLINRKKW